MDSRCKPTWQGLPAYYPQYKIKDNTQHTVQARVLHLSIYLLLNKLEATPGKVGRSQVGHRAQAIVALDPLVPHLGL